MHWLPTKLLMLYNFILLKIIEDPTFHLMNSKNQIITDYESSFNESLVALLPYSSLLSFEDVNGVYSMADTSTESWIQFDILEIKGPFL